MVDYFYFLWAEMEIIQLLYTVLSTWTEPETCFGLNDLVALSKHFKRSNLAIKNVELHAWVKKCHFGNFSERAGLAVPCWRCPQKCIIAIEKLFLFGC